MYAAIHKISMRKSVKPSLSYCGQEVYVNDRDHFLRCLFIPEDQREAFFCLYALNIELARVHTVVSEEMIGHIRYAWWFEAVEEIYETGKAKGQPVLQALEQLKLPQSVVTPLIIRYREHFPEIPCDIDEIVDTLALDLVRQRCPEMEARWVTVEQLIAKHRQRFGRRFHVWLIFKLLIKNIL
jgi:phytoene/squalene synthetase